MNHRAIGASFKQQYIQFVTDPQWIIPSIIAPFIFTAAMLMMYPEKSETIVLQAVLGGGVLGMWGNTLFASSFSLSYDRMNGSLENILMTPTDLFEILLGRSVWNSFIGLLNMLLVFIFAEIVFMTPVTFADPLAFVLILILTIASLASIGMIFAVAFVFSRRSYILTSLFEYPIYILSGALVPITMLPAWCNPISMVLAPTWGIEALRTSAVVGYSPVFGFGMWGNALMCLAIAIINTAIAWLAMRHITVNVRETGSFTRY